MVKDLLPSDPVMVGPYRLLGRLGQGGMGQVYRARSPGGRLVAVKVIRPELAGDSGFRARFAREVVMARKVSGMFTALVVDADAEGPIPWLATAYVAGPSLAEAVEEHGPLPVDSLLSLFAGLAEGLHAIHTTDMVHRDLKPSNVLLADDGPRVIDFGISRALESSMLTQTGTIMGTPGFLSPEQALGSTVGPPSDVFSLGAVLVFAATGEGPFGGGPATALLFRVVNLDPDLTNVPARVRPIVERCLAKDPASRPTTAQLMDEVGASVGVVAPDWLPEQFTMTLARYVPTSRTPATPARPAEREPAAGGAGVAGAGVADGPAVGDPARLTPAGIDAASAVGEPASPATPLPGLQEPVVAETAFAGAGFAETAVADSHPADPFAADPFAAGPVAGGGAPVTAISDTRADAMYAPPADRVTDPAHGAGLAGAASGTTFAPFGNDQLTQDARAIDPRLLPTSAVGAGGGGTTAPPWVGPGGGGSGGGGRGSGGTVVPLDKHPDRRRRRMILAAAAAIIVIAGAGAGFALASAGTHKPTSGPAPSLLSGSQHTTSKASATPSPTPSPTPDPTKTTKKPSPDGKKTTASSSPTAHVTTQPAIVNPTTQSVQPTTQSASPTPTHTTAKPTPTHTQPPAQSVSSHSGSLDYGCNPQDSGTSGSSVQYDFFNQSGANITVFEISPSGGAVNGDTLPPGGQYDAATATGDFWEVDNASNGCLGVYGITSGGSLTVS